MELARKTDETDHPWGLFKKKKRERENRKGDKRNGNKGSEKEDRTTRDSKLSERTVVRDRKILSRCPV